MRRWLRTSRVRGSGVASAVFEERTAVGISKGNSADMWGARPDGIVYAEAGPEGRPATSLGIRAMVLIRPSEPADLGQRISVRPQPNEKTGTMPTTLTHAGEMTQIFRQGDARPLAVHLSHGLRVSGGHDWPDARSG